MKLKPFIYALALAVLPVTGQAQSPYSEAVIINGNAVTYFEVDQRVKMLLLLGTLGATENQALDELIADRLRQNAARSMGISVTEEQLTAGLTEYAARANLTPEQFIEELGKGGVYPETFIDFVRAGLLWRQVIATRFQAKAFITEAELDTAMALGATGVGASVLISEVILPITEGYEQETLELAESLWKNTRSFKEFEDAALTYSSSASRANGGKLDWSPLAKLPPNIASMLITMGVGEVSKPIEVPGAYILFQMRGIRDNRTVVARTIAYDYATLLMPGGRSSETLERAAALAGSIDTCNDLAAKTGKYPEEAFSQQVVPLREVPKDIGIELATLDANEVSTNLTRGANGENLVFLMLCGRTNKISEGNREDVRMALFGQRMESFGKGYLQELLGDAIIIRK